MCNNRKPSGFPPLREKRLVRDMIATYVATSGSALTVMHWNAVNAWLASLAAAIIVHVHEIFMWFGRGPPSN